MASFHDRTLAPEIQTGLLPFVFRPVPPIDDPRSAVKLLDEIRRTIEGQVTGPRSADSSDLPSEPLLPARHGDTPICPAAGQTSEPLDVRHGGACGLMSTRHDIVTHAGRSDIATPSDTGSADRCSMPSVRRTARQTQHDVGFELPGSGDLETAQTLHMRRELHQALDFGFALLDALDLPPLALDVIDDGIAALDALDARYEDLEDDGSAEPSLGAPENHPARWLVDMAGTYHGGTRHHPLGDQRHWNAGAISDAEDDGDNREPEAGYDLACDEDELDGAGEVDAELSCGWTAKVDQVHLGQPQDDHETTALERYGKGFFRSGPDDAEDGHDAETVFEDGSEDEPYGWRFQRPNAVQIAARVTEVAHHG